MGLTRDDISIKRDLDVIRYFTKQFRALSDGPVLDLLERFEAKPFMNADVRMILGSKRQTAWMKLSRLADAGMVEKRGHLYRVSPFASEFVRDAASVLRHLMLGDEVSTVVDKGVLRVALEGVEVLYSKGKLGQNDYFRYRKALEEMGRIS
jgi:hypothetical protein